MPNEPEAQKSFWTHPMELLGDVGHVESHFILFGDSVSVGARLTHPMELQGDVSHLESRFFSFGDSVSVGAR